MKPTVTFSSGGTLRLTYLTPTELYLWHEIALGRQSKQIASQLGASRQTTEKHRANLLRKLGTSCVASLTRMAIERGVIPVQPVRPLRIGVRNKRVRYWL